MMSTEHASSGGDTYDLPSRHGFDVRPGRRPSTPRVFVFFSVRPAECRVLKHIVLVDRTVLTVLAEHSVLTFSADGPCDADI